MSYSSALGFIHTGKPLSFVYDIADLYKTETTIPAAFAAVAEFGLDEKAVRRKCREKFNEIKLMSRIVPDVDEILQVGKIDETSPAVGQLWDPEQGAVEGGQAWGEEEV